MTGHTRSWRFADTSLLEATFEEVAADIGLSVNRVRQVEYRALRRAAKALRWDRDGQVREQLWLLTKLRDEHQNSALMPRIDNETLPIECERHGAQWWRWLLRDSRPANHKRVRKRHVWLGPGVATSQLDERQR